ncbi:MAG: two pore domain potassium channel family protein [Flavobacteriales bacterium]|nr:two pore domain potassium channel family protein [Flavobacteriales bacterium]
MLSSVTMLPEPIPDTPLEKLIWGALLLALCVAVHAAGMIGLGRLVRDRWQDRSPGYFSDLWLLVRMAWMITLLHMVQIVVWAWFFTASGGLPNVQTAFYFSSVTYTTLGYGDVVLPPTWRGMSGLESLTGILTAGLSTGFFFNLLNRILEHRQQRH